MMWDRYDESRAASVERKSRKLSMAVSKAKHTTHTEHTTKTGLALGVSKSQNAMHIGGPGRTSRSTPQGDLHTEQPGMALSPYWEFLR